MDSPRITFIIECPTCEQPWEVDRAVNFVPRRVFILLPAHNLLSRPVGRPGGIPCPGLGSKPSALLHGPRSEWEQNRRLTRPLEPIPDVLDGSGLRVLT
jgi:hypothetical protein